jgi:hypothetical protein
VSISSAMLLLGDGQVSAGIGPRVAPHSVENTAD